MRKLILLILLLGAIRTLALDDHFIYIQSENGKPFYLSLNSKVYNSSTSGWLILPSLVEGDYQCNIGFPHNEWPDYRFKFKVGKTDMGFLLKNMGDKGWGLQNMQNMELTKGDLLEKTSNLRNKGALSSDPFSTMLASVVDDPTIREHPYVPVEEKPAAPVVSAAAKADSAKTVSSPQATATATSVQPTVSDATTKVVVSPAKKGKAAVIATKKTTTKKTTKPVADSLTAKDSLSSQPTETAKATSPKADSTSVTKATANPVSPSATNPAKTAAPLAEVGVRRTYQSNSTGGIDLVYVDRNEDGSTDTIRIFISKTAEETAKPPAASAGSTGDKDPKFLDMSVYPKTSESAGTSKPAVTSVQSAQKSDSTKSSLPEAATTNPNCKAVANDDDLFKLRKKIITKKDEDEMVAICLKEFKLHCYSADKIRSLSYIFLTQKGKYQLLDAAFPYVYDPSNFNGLSDILTDSYYINRFNALVQ